VNYGVRITDFKLNVPIVGRLLAVVCFTLILLGCANESVPQGGEKDVTPPKLKRVTPEDKSLHFNSNKITFQFNEFLKPTGFAQTLISPPLDKKPDIKADNKTVTVKFKSSFRPNTTYTINFADDIQDLNEGNTLNNFNYVFSTGDFIDSQSVRGIVILAKENTPAEGVIVSLYPADSISGIEKSKPYYFAKTDKAGNFQINNIKADRYQVYALKDQNYNYLYDLPNELIAFSDTVLDLTDSLPKMVTLKLFDENKRKLRFDGARSLGPGLIQLTYNKPISTFKLDAELYSASDFAYTFPTNDTVNYWYSKYYTKKAELFLVANDTLLDTVRIELKNIEKDSLWNSANNLLSIQNQAVKRKENGEIQENIHSQDLFKPVKINFTRPIIGINENKSLQIYKDSSTNSTNCKYVLDEKTRQSILVDFEKQENTLMRIEIPDSIFQDVLKTWNRKTVYKFTTNKKENYGNLHVTLKTDVPGKYYVVKLLSATNELIQEFFFTGEAERKITVNNIPAGTYKFNVIDDTNKNGVWDTGNFHSKIQPEKVFTYPDTYQLKGGWDLDITVKF